MEAVIADTQDIEYPVAGTPIFQIQNKFRNFVIKHPLKTVIMNLRNIFIAAAATLSLSAYAITLDEAKAAFAAGNYKLAAPELKAAADREPKNANINAMAGEALLYSGHAADATRYLDRAGASGMLSMAKYKMEQYDFDGADEWIEKYFKSKYKNKEVPENDPGNSLSAKMDLGRSMLDRVEKIAVIDSFTVDKDKFLQAFRLSAPTGQLSSPETLPENMRPNTHTAVYVTENGEHKMWGAPDSRGEIHLVESSLLADGTWEQPRQLNGAVNQKGVNSNFPFLMSDGVTLYFASNNPETGLGGYDIYISRNDGDSYLEPQNIGMPYNSPADDYMLAIDEVTGAGWWATDRNHIPGKVTIYLYVPTELRVNYSPDTPDLAQLARLSSIAATPKDGINVSKIKAAVDAIDVVTDNESNSDFEFVLPDGTRLHSLEDFASDAAAAAMESYLDKKDEMTQLANRLTDMRHSYAEGDKQTSSAILKAEKDMERMRTELRRLSNNIISTEMKAR